MKSKFSVFIKVLSSKEIIEELLSCTSLVFAPGLLEVLQSSTPPTVAFFKSLPTDHYKVWGVYLLVFEKQNSRTKIYIGSGTQADSGVSTRFRQYDKYDALPVYVKEALEEGYTIVHKGLLCSAPLPPAGVVPTTRLLFVALEAVFTFAFWAFRPKAKFYDGFPDICLWDRDTLEYEGLCSPNPLYETPGSDFNLTPKQLETMAAERAEKEAADARRYRNDASHRDPEHFREAERRLAAKDVESKKYDCEVCDHAFQTSKDLRVHNLITRHLHLVATQHLPEDRKYSCELCDCNPGSAYALKRHQLSKMHLHRVATQHLPEGRKYFCEVCNRNPGSSSELKRHQRGKKHLAKVAAAAAD